MEVQFRNPGILYTEIITEAVEIFSPQSGFVQQWHQPDARTRRHAVNLWFARAGYAQRWVALYVFKRYLILY